MSRGISTYLMKIFINNFSISNYHILPIFYLRNTNNTYHLSASEHFFLAEDNWPRPWNKHLKNFSKRFCTLVGHVYWIKFVQAFRLLSKRWIGMNETSRISTVNILLMKRVWLNTAEVTILTRKRLFSLGYEKHFKT